MHDDSGELEGFMMNSATPIGVQTEIAKYRTEPHRHGARIPCVGGVFSTVLRPILLHQIFQRYVGPGDSTMFFVAFESAGLSKTHWAS